MALVATSFEVFIIFRGKPQEKEGKLNQAVLSFSLIGSTKKLLSLRKSRSTENLAYVHGIRALSLLWVIMGHTWLKGPASLSANPGMLSEVSRTLARRYFTVTEFRRRMGKLGGSKE